MKNKGFTLIELVTVIVLLGILAAVAVPRFVNVQEQARTAQRAQLKAQIASGINMLTAYNIATGSSDPIPDPEDLGIDAVNILNEIPSGLTYATATGLFTYQSGGGGTFTMLYTKSGVTWSLSSWDD
jgi:MSHA pilin protein MshA